MMKLFELAEGEGIAGPFNEVCAITTTMYSCYAIVLENQAGQMAGLYHYPAMALQRGIVQATLRQMTNDIRPDHVHIVPGGIYKDLELLGLAPHSNAPTGYIDGMSAMVARNAAAKALEDYDKVTAFMSDIAPLAQQHILHGNVIGWYQARQGAVEVNVKPGPGGGAIGQKNNDQMALNWGSATAQGRQLQANISYYGGDTVDAPVMQPDGADDGNLPIPRNQRRRTSKSCCLVQ